MATDVEESDTDEHERPAPPKRQCTRLVESNESYDRLSRRLSEPKDVDNEDDNEESEYDEVEKLAREKLSRWQECQVAKGFLDNAINRVMENYTLYPLDDPQLRVFRHTEMEDTAVMMAIRNHGLVNTTDTLTRSQTLCASRMSVSCSSDERSCCTARLPETIAQSVMSLPGASSVSGTAEEWTEDKMDETDREEDFLERAVAEAIKKKGLSALSVDYG